MLHVIDERFTWLCELYKPASRIPAFLTVYDIAGLTKGASTGAGLGNAFLSHIRAIDAIFQVVRAFDDAEIVHVEGIARPKHRLPLPVVPLSSSPVFVLRVSVSRVTDVLGDVDPCRDLGIISDELRIKDMEFVEKHLEGLKKITGRGGQSLELKSKKEEQAIVEKVLKHLQEDKDVRKGDWNNKEVLTNPPSICALRTFKVRRVMTTSL